MFVYSRFNVLSFFTISLLFIGGGFSTDAQEEIREMKGYFLTLQGDDGKTKEDVGKLLTCASEDITLNITYLDKNDHSKGAKVTGESTTILNNSFLQKGFLAFTKKNGNIVAESLALSYVTVDEENEDSYINAGSYDLFSFVEPGDEKQYTGSWGGKPNRYDDALNVVCPYVLTKRDNHPDLDKMLKDEAIPNMVKAQECAKAFEYFRGAPLCVGSDIHGNTLFRIDL